MNCLFFDQINKTYYYYWFECDFDSNSIDIYRQYHQQYNDIKEDNKENLPIHFDENEDDKHVRLDLNCHHSLYILFS